MGTTISLDVMYILKGELKQLGKMKSFLKMGISEIENLDWKD